MNYFGVNPGERYEQAAPFFHKGGGKGDGIDGTGYSPGHHQIVTLCMRWVLCEELGPFLEDFNRGNTTGSYNMPKKIGALSIRLYEPNRERWGCDPQHCSGNPCPTSDV